MYIRTMLLIFLFVCSSSAQRQLSGSDCKTPHEEPGKCQIVHSCQTMLDVLENVTKPLSPEIRELLRAYQCGFEGQNPKVCCPSNPIPVGENDKNQPPVVSNHKNIQLVPKDCGHLGTVENIVGGNKTELLEFPWMALLSYRTSRGAEFKCGGTILNKNYILTAAHCVTNLQLSLIGVRVGDHDTRTEQDCEDDEFGEQYCAPAYQDLRIKQTIFHPRYDTKTQINDIALLRVSPIDLSRENSRPVCLPLGEARTVNFTNRLVVVTGWGITDNWKASPELLKVELPVIPTEQCREKYKNSIFEKTISKRQLCAGGRSKSDSCGGDSGGPLHVVGQLFGDRRYIQQGIVSYGPRYCGHDPHPGVYTRVAYYMDWLLDNLKE